MTYPVPSTYCSDPEAKFTVSSMSATSAGIDGYFTNYFDAKRVAKHLTDNGHTNVSVDPYDPTAKVSVGIHPLVEAKLRGY